MQPQDGGIRLKYEPEYDLLSVWLGSPEPADNVEVEPGFCIRVSRSSHRVVGLEVVSAAARFQKDKRVVGTPAFARSLIERYGPMALASAR